MNTPIVGKRVPRNDAQKQVTGRSIYVDDFRRPRLLYAKVLRSKFPHAKIVKVNISKAVNSPGVVEFLTAKDVPNNHWGFSRVEQPVLCDSVVRYRGDPVVAVAAETEEAADEALALVEIEYNPLPAVFEPLDALKSDAPIIHGESNVAATITIRSGDIEKGWQDADEFVEEEFKTQRVQHCHLEPHIALAEIDDQGKLRVYGSTQRVFRIAQDLSHILQIPQERILVKALAVGGGFGAKTEISVEPIVCLLAMKTRRPVKMQFSRQEEFLAAPIRHPMIAKYRSGINKDGRIVARQINLIYDTGAYVSQGQAVLAKAAINACGPYYIPNVQVDGCLVYTNTNIGSAMRGFGVPQVAFAYESHTDSIAKKIGIDPVDFRLMNMLKDGDNLSTGQILKKSMARETISMASKLVAWKMEDVPE